MFAYHLRLGLKSLRRNPVLTALMIGAIGLGIGVCLTTLNVYSLVSGNPLASRNNITYAVQMDGWDPNEPMDKKRPELAPFELTYRDAQAVYESEIPDRKVIMRKGAFVLGSSDEKSETKPYNVLGASHDPRFLRHVQRALPLRLGLGRRGGKQRGARDRAGRGGEPEIFWRRQQRGADRSSSTTRSTRSSACWITGIRCRSSMTSTTGASTTPKMSSFPTAAVRCSKWSPRVTPIAGSPNPSTRSRNFSTPSACGFSPGSSSIHRAKVDAFKSWLDGYVGEQKKLGRFQRPLNNRLSTVSEWLQLNEVVEKDNSVLLGISFMFLAVCLLNTVGLLLAKFSGKVGVVSLHRALGASRKMIFRQHLVEVSLIGIAGGLLGILLGFVLLLATRQLYNSYEAVTRLDWSVGLAALGIALAAGILAGLYPTWRICRVQPAPYLKTQ